jgi:hypothetical protein
MRTISKVTVGADPELFIYNKKTKKIISSIGIIPGEKGNAYTKDMPYGFGLQIDNILAEFNIPPVSFSNPQKFIEHIEWAKNYIRDFVRNIDPNLDILCKASAIVDDDQLQSEKARLFGCSVDYNVYKMEPNPKPEGEKTNLRTTGCHIHVGYDKPDIDSSCMLVKYMDSILGLFSVLADDDTERRKLYGKAGCFRLTNYGVEYRVLSGLFISSRYLIEKVFELTKQSIRVYNNSLSIPPNDVLEQTINNGDKVTAQELLTDYYSYVPEIMHCVKPFFTIREEKKMSILEI